MGERIAIYLTNLGRYNEGCLMGEWVKLPIDKDKLQQVLNRIGINEQYLKCCKNRCHRLTACGNGFALVILRAAPTAARGTVCVQLNIITIPPGAIRADFSCKCYMGMI